MLDGAVKTIMVDDSKTVGELLVTICSRIGTSYLCFLVLPILSVLQICWICAEPLWTHTHKKRIIFPCEILFLLSLMGILSFPRHYKLRGILSDPGDGGGEEGGWHGYPEERQNTFARREEDGKAESQASHRRWLWVQERKWKHKFSLFFLFFLKWSLLPETCYIWKAAV